MDMGTMESGLKNVQIREDLWAAAKIAAINERMTLREWLDRAVRQALKKDGQKR